MQLSVTNPSIDPNIAPFLLGNFSPAAVAAESADGAPPVLAGFAQLLAQTAPANAGQSASDAGANETTVPGEFLASDPSAGGLWIFAASSPPSNLAVTPSSAVDLANDPNADASPTSVAAATQPPAGATAGATAGRDAGTGGIISSGAPKPESRAAAIAAPTMKQRAAMGHFAAHSATRSDEGESARRAPGRTETNAGKESSAETIAPATLPMIESPIVHAVRPNDSDASAAASSIQPISESTSNFRGSAAPASVPHEIARAEALVVKGTRVPFSGVTASVVPPDKFEVGVTGVPAATTPRAADLISSANPSGSTVGSSSPFDRGLPSRNLAEWPLTAQPRSQSNAGTESIGAEKAMPTTARDGVNLSQSLPLVTARAGAVNPIVASSVPAISNPAGSAAVLVANTPPPASGSTETPSFSIEVPASTRVPALPQPLSARVPHSSVPVSVVGTPASSAGTQTAARAASAADSIRATVQPHPASNTMPAEKFAVPMPSTDAVENIPDEARTKSFVSSDSQKLTVQFPDLGTGVAKPLDAMFSAPPLPLIADAAHDSAAWAVVPGGEVSADISTEMPAGPEPLSTAHRAVEAVLTAVHRFSSRDQHAVNLQFTVGGADLSVRVEMRADQVRATFTTDSVELRAALAHEWHAAQSTPSGERPVRLANPVFASTEGSSSGAAGDQDASRHRQASTPPTSEPFTLAGLRSRAARAAAFEASVPMVTPVISRAPLSTALHLHTLA